MCNAISKAGAESLSRLDPAYGESQVGRIKLCADPAHYNATPTAGSLSLSRLDPAYGENQVGRIKLCADPASDLAAEVAVTTADLRVI